MSEATNNGAGSVKVVQTVEEYLRTVAEVNIAGKVFGGGFAKFVLDYGHQFPVVLSQLPEGIRKGTIKRCFTNAACLAIMGRDRFTYCEGYASGIFKKFGTFPTLHAWVIDDQGRVVDNTWYATKSISAGTDYYGIPFRGDFLHKWIIKYKKYGLIDAPPDFRILHMTREQLQKRVIHPDYIKSGSGLFE